MVKICKKIKKNSIAMSAVCVNFDSGVAWDGVIFFMA